MNAILRRSPVQDYRLNPFRELEEMQNRLASVFGAQAGVRPSSDKKEALTVAEWAPLVDIVEDGQEYLIKAEVPEVTKDNIKVTFENDVLTITGERKSEK